MPPLCRAAEPGGEPPGPILAAALAALTDAAARARLAAGAPGWSLLPPRRGRRSAQIPVAEQWAAALTGPDPDVQVDAEDIETAAALAVALDDWRTVAEAPAGPVRTCFRLVEPSAEPDEVDEPAAIQDAADVPWRVEFALQSTEDPSLMLPADDVWAGTGGWSPGVITFPDEELLAGLGAASRLFEELDTALRAAAGRPMTNDSGTPPYVA
jgi:hypothetical protein